MSNHLESFRVSARKHLHAGVHFKTVKGSGPTFSKTPVGVFSVFRCVNLYRKRSRIYCQAIDVKSGSVHDIYLKGPAFSSSTGTREKPYKIRLLTASQVEKLTSRKRRKRAS